ncbi:MAG: flagellar M-ring protein FliF C-terminal domain-containing protein [Vulcanimicrobiaceae bacterium]
MTAAAMLSRWNALPRSMRAGTVACVVVALALVVVSGAVTHPARSALFATPLRPEQVAEVEERLASWNVPFTPAADNVVVDPNRRSDLLLRLSLSGVPHAHIETSDDLLTKVGALTPQAVIDAQTRDGLAGDIELGLRGMDGIDDARVIIAPAKPGYFADEQSHDATASVRLRLHPGVRLTHDAVAGIAAFVAASVAGLDRAHVTIVDDRGVELGGGRDETADSSELQSSLQSALDAAIGSGASIVRVRFDYDDRAQQMHEIRREPLAVAPIASTTDNEQYTGGGKRYDRSQAQVDRGSETRESTTSSQPGRIARISVAVFVDASRGADLYKVRALAAASAGLNPARGDSITVQAIGFARTPAARRDGWWLAYGAIVPLLPTLAVVVAVLIALRWAANPVASLVQRVIVRANIARTVATAGVAPSHVRGVLQGEPAHTAAAIISALPAATAAAVLDMYPEHERAAIVRRMQRRHSPLLADAEKYVADA